MNLCCSAGILFLVFLTLCNSANGADAPDEQVNERCRAGVKLSVSGGNNPIFDWPADCAVHQLIVEDDWTNRNSWAIEAERNGIRPAIVYGQVPEGAQELNAVIPLKPGVRYTVALIRFHGPKPYNTGIIAAATFTLPAEGK
jgi:hypothetical protein